MHEAAEGELNEIAQPTLILSCTNELKVMEITNSETDLPENHQDNGATPPVNTQTSLLHTAPEDTSVAYATPPPFPHIEAGNNALKVREGDLPDVRLLGAYYMLYSVY